MKYLTIFALSLGIYAQEPKVVSAEAQVRFLKLNNKLIVAQNAVFDAKERLDRAKDEQVKVREAVVAEYKKLEDELKKIGCEAEPSQDELKCKAVTPPVKK